LISQGVEKGVAEWTNCKCRAVQNELN